MNQSAKSLLDDAANVGELRASPDFYVGPAGPKATLQGTGYRYMRLYNEDGTVNKYALTTLDLNAAPVTYFGFEKSESGVAARDGFQIKGPEFGDSWSDAKLVGTFDTLQLFDAKGTPTVRHPYFAGDDISTGKIEPFTEAYPQYGKGGVEQITADRQEVKFHTLDILPHELKPDVKESVPTILNGLGDTAVRNSNTSSIKADTTAIFPTSRAETEIVIERRYELFAKIHQSLFSPELRIFYRRYQRILRVALQWVWPWLKTQMESALCW